MLEHKNKFTPINHGYLYIELTYLPLDMTFKENNIIIALQFIGQFWIKQLKNINNLLYERWVS